MNNLAFLIKLLPHTSMAPLKAKMAALLRKFSSG